MSIELTAVQRKILSFALFGAAGCFVAALVGELWLSATWRAPIVQKQPLAVCLLLDCSGSMSGPNLAEMKAAASSFVQRRQGAEDEIAIVGFGSQVRVAAPLSTQHAGLQTAINSLTDGGGTNMAAGLREALAQLQTSERPGNVLLFTDGQPNSQPDTLLAAGECRTNAVKIVTLATPDVDRPYMNSVTGDPALVMLADIGSFEQAFQQAEKKIFGRQLAESTPTRAGFGYALMRMGMWTALLAAGLALALIVGQNHYLRRTLLDKRQAIIGGFSGLAAGLLAGAIGQLVFAGTTDASSAVVEIVRIFGWTVLGALVGVGLAMFVPNLKPLRGMAGGAVGGIAGAIGFFIVGLLLGDVVARLLGAAIVGFCIGAMIALIEAVFREAWLEIHYGPKEMRTVALGRTPIAIGSNAESCTVFASGAANVALRYTLQDGHISCEDVPAERTFDVEPGDRRTAGNLDVVVCAARPTLSAASRPEIARQTSPPSGSPGEQEVGAATPMQSDVSDAPFQLRIRGRRIPLALGSRLTASDVAGLETTEPDGAVAEVAAHPQNPDMLGLRNLSTRPWSATMANGKQKQVEPGKNVRLATGITIEFGVLKGRIE